MTGRLARERDVEGLLSQLRWLVSHTDEWESLSRRARERVEQEFNAWRQGEGLAAIYASLVN